MVCLLIGLTTWSGLFIGRTSVVIDGERSFFLFDDALISMSYARNLAAGLGPVWTPGNPPVEGFTNPLWTALMVPVNALPLPLHHRPLVVQLGGVLLLGLTVWRVRKLLCMHFTAHRCGVAGWLPAAIFTAFHYSLSYWSLLGMETSLQALLAVLSVHLAYDIVYRQKDRLLALFLCFCAAYLTRMDMALLILVVSGWIALQGGFRETASRRWLAGLSLLAVAVGGYQVFRWTVFGPSFPNTYYLKLGGVPFDVRLGRGLAKAGEMLRENWALAAAVTGAVLSGCWKDGRRAPIKRTGTLPPNKNRSWLRGRLGELRDRLASPVVLPGILLVVYCSYSIWVGGDAWELPEINIGLNRFVVFLVPLAGVLINDMWNRLRQGTRQHRWGWATAALTLLMLLAANGLILSPRRDGNLRKVLLLDRPVLVESTVLVYLNLRKLQERLAPGAKVVTYWAGVPAYFSDYEMVDALGYADSYLAHLPLPPEIDATQYRPGHHKSDAAYLLAQRPDAFFQFWDIDRLPVRWPRRHLRQSGYAQVGEFWLRRDSPYLLPGALAPP